VKAKKITQERDVLVRVERETFSLRVASQCRTENAD